MFLDGTWAEYSSEKMDYTWNVIKHERAGYKFTGKSLTVIGHGFFLLALFSYTTFPQNVAQN